MAQIITLISSSIVKPLGCKKGTAAASKKAGIHSHAAVVLLPARVMRPSGTDPADGWRARSTAWQSR